MKSLHIKVILYLLIIGAAAGFIGIILTVLMHTIQHYAFGYGFYGEVSFREVVEYASPLRRLIVLTACGMLVGGAWFVIHRICPPLVSIKQTVDDPTREMPVKTTVVHAVLQIITVALGSPLGREVAPREISAAFATKLSQVFHVDTETRKLLLACASGAGLAAVYNVPLAAAIFSLETLLMRWDYRSVSAAFLCSGTAVYVVRQGLGDLVQYPLPQVAFGESTVLFAALIGPFIAIAVIVFEKSLKPFPFISRNNPKIIAAAIISFFLIGVLSMYYPEILGNGKAGNQLSFTDMISWQYGLGLLSTKWLAVILATAAGAYGGRITPSMMLGGMIGMVSAIFWNILFPSISVSVAVIAFVGAAIFLGLAQKMPVTAIVFLLELSRFSPAYLFPMCACLATALLVYNALQFADVPAKNWVENQRHPYMAYILSHIIK